MIYSLNTKNDDLEYDMEAMRVAYEDKLQKVRKEQTPPHNLTPIIVSIHKQWKIFSVRDIALVFVHKGHSKIFAPKQVNEEVLEKT